MFLDMLLLAGDVTDIPVVKGEFMTLQLKNLNASIGKYFVSGMSYESCLIYLI